MADSRDSKLATPKRAHSHGKSTLGRAINNIKEDFTGHQNDDNVEPQQITEIGAPTLVHHNPPDPEVKELMFLLTFSCISHDFSDLNRL